MGQPYVGEIRMFAGNFAPSGWQFCAGQLLPIANYDTLFNLIGTTYGGDGQNTFGLPDLRSRVPIHQGTGPGLPTYVIGQQGGTENVTLTTQQIPVHTHAALAAGMTTSPTNAPSNGVILSNEVLSNPQGGKVFGTYVSSSTVTMAPQSIGSTGGSQPHDNLQPYLAVNFIISMFGVFPSQT